LLGSDAFLQLHTWHEWKRLFGLAHIVVMQRPGRPLGNTIAHADAALQKEYAARLAPSPKALREAPCGHIVVIDMPGLDISATDIRRRIATGKSIRYLIPDSVYHFILTHNLYTHADH
jgi:nicotinate-nucleotide adenylyltransferase